MSPMHSPVWPDLRRRQALLFVVAILVPCVVLVALGLRTIDQERQLESNRLADERHLLNEQARQALLSDLEKIKLQQVTQAIVNEDRTDGVVSKKRSVAFVGPVVEGELRLP